MIFALCIGGGHLNAVDAVAADEAACEGAGLNGPVPDSRRLGGYLARFSAKALDGLQACVRAVNAQVVPPVAAACGKELGYVPVLIDGTGIEVQGKRFEGAAVSYKGVRQYWLHSVLVGRAWVLYVTLIRRDVAVLNRITPLRIGREHELIRFWPRSRRSTGGTGWSTDFAGGPGGRGEPLAPAGAHGARRSVPIEGGGPRD